MFTSSWQPHLELAGYGVGVAYPVLRNLVSALPVWCRQQSRCLRLHGVLAGKMEGDGRMDSRDVGMMTAWLGETYTGTGGMKMARTKSTASEQPLDWRRGGGGGG